MKLWIVGRVFGSQDEWEFVGVFSTQEKAEAACYDRDCFVGPAELDVTLPHEPVLWPDSYYPLVQA